MSENELLEVEDTARVEEAIQMGEDLTALRKNPHFQRLIMQNYLEKSVLSSVSMLGVPQVQKSGQRGNIMEDLVSASNLMFFFRYVDQQYDSAKNPVLTDEEEAELEATNANDGVAH